MENEFNSRISFLNYDDVRLFYKKHKIVELNNVLEGFDTDFFTIMLHEEESLNEYTLFYIGGLKEIRGLALKSGRKIEERDFCTLNFSKAIEDEFPEKNSLVVFNTFQSQLKKVYENFGILCIPENIENLGKELTFILPNNDKNSVDRIMQVNILEIYKSFFNREVKTLDRKGLHKVYLMYDQKEGYVKIGETKNILKTRKKGVAEPTLRATDPMIELVTAWEGTKELEMNLHSKYISKRKRGEWFDLRATDLRDIDKMTSIYKMIEL